MNTQSKSAKGLKFMTARTFFSQNYFSIPEAIKLHVQQIHNLLYFYRVLNFVDSYYTPINNCYIQCTYKTIHFLTEEVAWLT